MQIEHLILLIHPCCYEPLSKQQIEEDGLQLFLDREEVVKQRWLTGLQQAGPSTLYVQLGGPGYLAEAAVEALGESRSLTLSFPFPENEDLSSYYAGLTAEIRSHMAAHSLQFDPDTVSTELWGESFEGCVPGYGGAFAQYLGLSLSPRMRFDMTVFDSRFLHQARYVETLAIIDDVEAWLFECHDGTLAATFQPRRSAQWLDDRLLCVELADDRHQLCDKRGHTLWPADSWSKGMEPSTHRVRVPMRDWINRWVRGIHTGADAFRAVIAAARVDPPTG